MNSVTTRAKASSASLVLTVVIAGTLLATPLRAQSPTRPSAADSTRAAADSILARLRRAEEAIALLQQQLAEQASSGVATHSRMRLELSGRVLMNVFSNSARVNNVDDPQFVRPDTASPLPLSGLGMAIRQSTFGAVLTANVLGGRFTGDVDMDFFGGQQPSTGGREFPLPRIRTARATVRWTNWELMAGQESPLIAGLNPVSPAAIGTPDFAAAGNLWLWLPQVRATWQTNGSIRVGVQGALLANITGDAAGTFDTDFDPAEHTSRPAVEERVFIRWGEDERTSEIGCGGHLGWIDVAGGQVQGSAVACDVHISILSGVELRGEAYGGYGLRGLGGGGIGQNLDRNNNPFADQGAWGQLNMDPVSLMRVGAGCGIDAPNQPIAFAPGGGRLRNASCAGYTILRPGGPIFIAGEYRWLQTKYDSGTVSNTHLNLSLGFEF